MRQQLLSLASYLLVGAIVGFLMTHWAPKACQRFHEFSSSTRSRPVHWFGVVFFSMCTVLTLASGDYINAVVSAALTVLSVVALRMVSAPAAVSRHDIVS